MRSLVPLALVALVACAVRDEATPQPVTSAKDGGPATTGDGGAPTPDASPEDAALPIDAPAPSGALTILSLNLHCLKNDGTSFTTNPQRFEAIALAAARERVDAILAQEVCASASEDARALLVAALQKATGASWSSAAALAHQAWQGTADEAAESVAIFSRLPLSSPRETAHRAQGTLRRVTLGATLTTGVTGPSGAPLAVLVHTVHLDHETATVREGQAREVASLALAEADEPAIALTSAGGTSLPVVVGGDFNATYAAEAPQALAAFGFVESSGSDGGARIDHVFMHRSAPLAKESSKEVFTGKDAVSDHPGVIVRFVAAAPAPVRLTRIVARGTFAAPLAVRGDRAPLSWGRGWPAYTTSAGQALVTSELPASPFAYKFLREDRDWATGGNAAGAGETDNTSTPTFP